MSDDRDRTIAVIDATQFPAYELLNLMHERGEIHTPSQAVAARDGRRREIL